MTTSNQSKFMFSVKISNHYLKFLTELQQNKN